MLLAGINPSAPSSPILPLTGFLQISHLGFSCFSHFTAPSFPFSETCFLFSTCEEVLDCTECTTETNSCPGEEEELCSGAVEGTLGQNIVEFIPDVESEAACLEACSAHTNCSFYTHHRFLETDCNKLTNMMLLQ